MKKYFCSIPLLLLGIFFSLNVTAQYANSLLWKVTGNDLEKPSYLYGTMHLQDKRVFELTDLIEDKLKECDALALEIVMTDPSGMGMNPEMLGTLMMDGGKKLDDMMSSSDYRKVKRLVEESMTKMMPEGDMGFMQNMMINMVIKRVKPLYVSTLITGGRVNMDMDQPLDMHLQSMAQELEKELISIESIEEQMAALNSIDDEEQAKMLTELVNNIEEADADLEQLTIAYQQQNLNLIDSLSNGFGETEGEQFEEALLTKRNLTMAHRIDSIYQKKPTFAAVGAAHLVGKNGLILALREKGYTVTPVLEEASNTDYKELCQWMTGSFNSATQAQEDSAFYDINLEMHPIWEGETEDYWIYVEQAMSSKKEKPYRQRIYQVTQIDSITFASYIYTLPEPEEYIGSWTKPELFKDLILADSLKREGCEVILKKEGDQYVGATGENSCSSSLRGATYATSEVTVTKDGIISWDRGYDKEGKQVWGAEKGGYIFKRLEEE